MNKYRFNTNGIIKICILDFIKCAGAIYDFPIDPDYNYLLKDRG